MVTINAEIKKGEKRVDGSYNVKIRITQNGRYKRLATDISVFSYDLNREGKIKRNSSARNNINNIINEYRSKCDDIPHIEDMNIEQIVKLLHTDTKSIDFISFANKWIGEATIKGKDNYRVALNAFIKFLKKDSLDITKLKVALLTEYKKYLEHKIYIRNEKLKKEGKRIPSNRMITLYLSSLRHLYKEAQLYYNDYDSNNIVLPNSPFDYFKIPRQEATRKRALTKSQLLSIYKLPYKEDNGKETVRYNLAKDCFLLSFCLIGMNSVDLFSVDNIVNNRIIYNRTKTRDRRLDKALMEVDIPDVVQPIVNKYRDYTKSKVFIFHTMYVNRHAFNRALNIGLKEIGKEVGIDDLEFYAARHTWATLAVNEVKIDKYTVHAALNHIDESMRVTDIYIQRNFVIENEANSKVIDYVFGETLQQKLDEQTPNVSPILFCYSHINFAVKR